MLLPHAHPTALPAPPPGRASACSAPTPAAGQPTKRWRQQGNPQGDGGSRATHGEMEAAGQPTRRWRQQGKPQGDGGSRATHSEMEAAGQPTRRWRQQGSHREMEVAGQPTGRWRQQGGGLHECGPEGSVACTREGWQGVKHRNHELFSCAVAKKGLDITWKSGTRCWAGPTLASDGQQSGTS